MCSETHSSVLGECETHDAQVPTQTHFKTHSPRQPSDLRSMTLGRSQVALYALIQSLPTLSLRFHLLHIHTHNHTHTLPTAPVTLNYLDFLDSTYYLKILPYLLPQRLFFPP